MTVAEKELVKYLIKESGIDNCQKCIHCEKNTCGRYIPDCKNQEEQYSGECDIEYCIDGMVKFYEKGDK